MKILKVSTPFFLFALLCSCSPFSKKAIIRDLHNLETKFQHHAGFVLFDPESKEFVINHNGDKYFTPASNTKIFTLFTAMRTLGDSLPGMYYIEQGDSLIFWGTGDPALLNSLLPDSRVYDFLAETEKELYFSSSNFFDDHFGPGWAWDDYMYTYSSEKSPMPVYGNNFSVIKRPEIDFIQLAQPYFKQFFWLGDTLAEKSRIIREPSSNNVMYFPSLLESGFEEQIPFHYSDFTLAGLLSDTLKKDVTVIDAPLPAYHKTLYSIPSDSAYKLMMQESDNFIAEQLLLVCAGILSDSLDAEIAIDFSTEHYLSGMPDKPIWIDGSGLSRYNLFTPRSIVWLWHQLFQQFTKEELWPLLASGGNPGTLKKYYTSAGNEKEPYIIGKTGTLSNNHSLSGFLITKKGKMYIFAFMNNNFPTKSIYVKKEMEKILNRIYTGDRN